MPKRKYIVVFVLTVAMFAMGAMELTAAHAASIILRSVSTGSTTSSSSRDSVTIPAPAGLTSGQVLIAQLAVRGGAGQKINAPGGWSLVRRDNSGGSVAQAAYFHVVSSSSEPSSYTWTFNAGNDAAGGIAAYVGALGSEPIDVSGGQNNGVSAIITAPSISLPHTGDRVVALFAIAGTSPITDPPSMNQRWNFRSASYGISVVMSDLTYSSNSVPSVSSSTTVGSANVGAQIALVQQSAGSPPPSSGGTYPKSDAECAAAVSYSSWEPRPDNTAANNRTPTSSQLASFHAPDVNGGVPASAFDQVDGNFTGTTDEIMQWAACKWGFDPDLVRAIAIDESYWHQSSVGDYTSNESRCPPGTWNGSGCYQTYGLLQIKYPDYPGTWPMSRDDTAFSTEYKLAYQRACMNGKITQLIGTAGYPNSNSDTMLWGCVGQWYSGGWYDSGAQTYIARIKTYMSQKVWLTW
jgi:hypothetical protein